MSADPEDTLVLETTHGTVVIAMRPDLAPNHVARIKELVGDGFYDGLVFHRVIDGFMAQTNRGLGPKAQGGILQGEACTRHRLHGARTKSGLGRQPVLHLLRRLTLAQWAIYRLGPSHAGNGERRQDQARGTRQQSGPHHFREAAAAGSGLVLAFTAA